MVIGWRDFRATYKRRSVGDWSNSRSDVARIMNDGHKLTRPPKADRSYLGRMQDAAKPVKFCN
jgi:hypothetical protein